MKKHLFISSLTLVFLTIVGCDPMDERERLIYEKPEAASRVVLLEDFTGQRCVNCPKATDVIGQLREVYGDDAFVAVSIHAGPLGFAGNDNTLGLATATGDEYYTHWQLEYQPIGLVNRQAPLNYPEWGAAVREELSKPASLSLFGKAELTDNSIEILINAIGTDGATQGKLQVWLLEDSITALQLMPDGTANHGYIHNHVFRTAVNGSWGDEFSIDEGQTVKREMRLPVDVLWNVRQLSIVAFVYNESGVLQTTKFKVDN